MNEKFIDMKEKQITLCQKLIPMGNTRKNIDKLNAMASDRYIDENKSEVRRLIRLLARNKMEESILKIKEELDFTNLFNLMTEYSSVTDDDKDEYLEKIFDEKVGLAEIITSGFDFKFESAKTINEMLPEFVEKNFKDKEKAEYLNLINEVRVKQAMFNRYEQHIDTMFGVLMKKGTIVYRILFENAQIFNTNLSRINEHDYNEIIDYADIDEESRRIIIKRCINIDASNYNDLLIQENIDKYNYAVGMANSIIKIYCDRNREKYKDYELKTLYKMMLCEKESFFDKIDTIRDDDEAISLYNKLVTELNNAKLLESFNICSNNIYIKPNEISRYSNIIYGKWNTVKECITAHCSDLNVAKKKKMVSDKEYEEYIKKGITIEHISDVVREYAPELNITCYENDLVGIISGLLAHHYLAVNKENISLKADDSTNAETMKKELDTALKVLDFLKLYDTDNEMFDSDTKISIEELIDKLSPGIRLYNILRNYITAKPSPKKKLSLMFDTSSFGSGWSESVENSKRVTLLKDDEGNKYFAIYNINGCRANNIPLSSVVDKVKASLMDESNGECYQKLVYSSVPSALKDIPRIFINKCGDEEFIKKFKTKVYKSDETFKDELISMIKKKINEHPTWSKYNFDYKESYTTYEEFCEDIDKQGYYAKWKYINKNIIDEFVENGCMYLFKIYNKDYSKHKKSDKKKIHTRYLDYLFSDENVHTKLVKLLGGAEFFYREPQIDKPYIHKKGSVLLNKKYKNGQPIGNNYSELLKRVQTEEVENVCTKVAPYDIIKDRRYTMEQFELHFPISVGIVSNDNFEELAKEKINAKGNTVVVGRSRHDLLYVSVYDENNNIIFSKSLNIIKGTDYASKLAFIEEQKKENVRNWKTIGSNEGLLQGYISAAIREVTDLIIRYDAIVVIETGDKSAKGRQLLPNRSYAHFKEALMRKLEFLVVPGRKDDEPGGLLHPYHLTDIDRKRSSRSINKEWNGIVLQVPSFYAGYTDPESNVCDLTFAKNHKEKVQVLESVKNITYNKDEDVFEFDYDLSTFNRGMAGVYHCIGYGDRIIKQNDELILVNLTEYIKSMFDENNISYNNDSISIDMDDKKAVSAIYSMIRYTLQMNNISSIHQFFISPVTGKRFDNEKSRELMYNENLYKRSVLLKNKVITEKKIKQLTIKELYAKPKC